VVGKDQELHRETADTNLHSELPEGWAFPKISDLLAVNYGKGLKKSSRKPGPVPVYGSNGVVGQHNSALTEGPTIILGRKGTVGAVNFSTVPCWPIDTTYFIDRFNGLAPQFIFYALRSLNLSDLDTSTAIPGLNRNDIYRQYVPLPPIPEQKRIVAKAEELLARVNAARERLAKVKEILKRLRQSILSAACSGLLTADWREKHPDAEPASELLKLIRAEREKAKRKERKKQKKPYLNRVAELKDIYFDIPDSWSSCFFEDICANKPHAIKAGPFGSSLTKSCYTPSGYKIYGQEQVIRGDANYGDYYIDEKKFLELKSCEVEARDLLISLVGTIGKVLLIPDKFEKGIINPRLVKISLDSKVSPEYIAKYLTSTLTINIFRKDSHGGTMEILNLKILKRLPIPLPPVQEQEEIVRRVKALFKIADQIEERYQKARAYVDKLTQSILAKAFRGELVPQDPNDEPASVLLERIREERAKNEATGKIGGMKRKKRQ